MNPPARHRRSSPWSNVLLVIATVVLGVGAAEATVRVLNGQPLFAFPLPDALPWDDVKPEDLDAVPRVPGVQRSWFEVKPQPLSNRKETPPDWRKLYDELAAKVTPSTLFRPIDSFKVWNTARLPTLCARRFFAQSPAHINVYDPPDGDAAPPYRFLPNATFPNGLVTNQMGKVAFGRKR